MALDILLVDDDPDFANTVAETLRGEGHRVDIAHDAGSGFVAASRLPPDVVLLDLGLPDADGYDVAHLLRRTLPRATPIIVISGRDGIRFVEDFDLLLSKPIQTELFGGLLEYVRRRRLSMTPVEASR